jgi:branched-chain amino acid transport system substrate-binding protein
MRFLVILVIACIPLFSCTTARAAGAKSTRMVLVDGENMLAEEHADKLLQQAKTAERSEQKKLYRRVVDEYADTSVRGHAALALAELLLDEADPASHAEATRTLEAFVRDDPNHERGDDARALLPVARLKSGIADDAAIDAAMKDVPDADKPAAMQKLAAQMRSAGQGEAALRVLARARAATNDASVKQAIENDIVATLDGGGIPFERIERMQQVDVVNDPFLLEMTTWKLARIRMHMRDVAGASALAQQLQQKFPRSRFAADAQALVAASQARVEVKSGVVGVILPLSGEYASYGKRALAALQLAFGATVTKRKSNDEPTLDPSTGEPIVQKANDAVATRSSGEGGLTLVVRDSAGRADVAAGHVRSLVESEHVMAIVGDLLMDTALPVAMAAEEYGVPLISLSRKSGVPEAGPYSFRLALTPRKQAKAIARVAVEGMDIKRFGIMYPRSPFGVEVMNELWDELDARRVEVTAVESYGLDQTTFTAEARALAARGKGGGGSPGCSAGASDIDNAYRRKKALESCNSAARPLVDWDALIIPDGFRTVSYVVPALVAEDVLLTNSGAAASAYRMTTGGAHAVQMFGTNTWNDPELARRVGSQIRGALFVDAFDPANTSNPQVRSFTSQFSEAMGSKPQLTDAQAYDAGRILVQLLGAKPKTRDELRGQLDALTDYEGVTGVISFDDQGDSQAAPLFFRVLDSSVERVPMSQLLKPRG